MAGDKERDDIARHAAAVARQLLGDPNKQLSGKDELRFGTNGSMSLEVAKGAFFDHEAKVGGGVLWLIERMTGKSVEGGHAVEWLRDNGFHVEDRGAPPAGDYGAGSAAPARRAGEWVPPGIPEHAELTATYDYTAADGTLVYQVVRYDWSDPSNPKGHSKNFRQRQPDSGKAHGWNWKVKGLTPLPYRLPELIEAVGNGYIIFIVEGEKKADRLADLGAPATCNSGGAGKFADELVPYFKGARVVILPDNDEAGLGHASLVAEKLKGTAESVKILHLPDLPPKGDVIEWTDNGGTLERLFGLAATTPEVGQIEYRSRFDAVSWLDLDAPGPEHEWLIKGVLTRNELSMTAGASQAGKSFAVLDAALAIARGVPWLDRKTRRGGVVYCAPEGARGLRRKRLRAYRQFYEIGSEPIPFTLLQSPLDLYGGDDVTDALIEEIKHWARTYDCPLELVVIDTFSKATPGMNENDGADVSKVLERCDRIRRSTGAHVMLVHHLNADGTKARGHTSIFANLENVILVRKVEDHHDNDGRAIREVEIKKQKEGEDGTVIRFVLHSVQIGVDADGDPVTSCVIGPPAGNGQAKKQDEGIALGDANKVVLRALYDVLEKDGTFAPPELKLPFGTLVVSRRLHGARFAEISIDDDVVVDELPEADRTALRNRLRAALKRGRDTLYAKKIIGIDESFIWATGRRVMGFGPPPGQRPERPKQSTDRPPADDTPFSID